MPHAVWADYLDSLAAAAHAVLDSPAGTADGPPPVFPVLEQPDSPLPAGLEARRDDVMRLLNRTTRELERRQSRVVEELSSLRPRTPRSAYHSQAGDAVDVVG